MWGKNTRGCIGLCKQGLHCCAEYSKKKTSNGDKKELQRVQKTCTMLLFDCISTSIAAHAQSYAFLRRLAILIRFLDEQRSPITLRLVRWKTLFFLRGVFFTFFYFSVAIRNTTKVTPRRASDETTTRETVENFKGGRSHHAVVEARIECGVRALACRNNTVLY